MTAALTLAGGLSPIAFDDTEAKKRKKNKKKRNGRGGDQGADQGGGAPGDDAPAGPSPGGGDGGNECPFTLCEGQCVDLASDQNNCGVCSGSCSGDAICIGGRCVEAIGSQGNGVGEFNNPAGMAFDGDGIFFVTDSGNQRVVGALGEPFRENLLVRPFGIAANTVTGDIYVTGADSSTLLRFRSNGDLVGTFGSFGSGIEQFRSPLGVAVDDAGATPTNRVFVADTGNSRIQRLSASGFFAARFGREGSAVGEFRNPEGIAINRNGNVVVADTGNHRIQVLNQTGEMILAFGSQGSGNGQFNRPVAVALDDDDNIHVVDQGNNRVQRFSSDGQFLEAFGQPGSGIGQFNAPTGITIATDALIAVADTGNHRVQGFFTPEPPNDNLSIETRSSLLQPSASGSGKRKPNDRDSSRQGRTRGDGPSNR